MIAWLIDMLVNSPPFDRYKWVCVCARAHVLQFRLGTRQGWIWYCLAPAFSWGSSGHICNTVGSLQENLFWIQCRLICHTLKTFPSIHWFDSTSTSRRWTLIRAQTRVTSITERNTHDTDGRLSHNVPAHHSGLNPQPWLQFVNAHTCTKMTHTRSAPLAQTNGRIIPTLATCRWLISIPENASI